MKKTTPNILIGNPEMITTIVNNLCMQLIEMQQFIAIREPGERFPTVQEVEVTRKLIMCIEKMQKMALAAEIAMPQETAPQEIQTNPIPIAEMVAPRETPPQQIEANPAPIDIPNDIPEIKVEVAAPQQATKVKEEELPFVAAEGQIVLDHGIIWLGGEKSAGVELVYDPTQQRKRMIRLGEKQQLSRLRA